MSVESIRRRIMLKREPKTGNLKKETILSESLDFRVCMYRTDTITLTIYFQDFH